VFDGEFVEEFGQFPGELLSRDCIVGCAEVHDVWASHLVAFSGFSTKAELLNHGCKKQVLYFLDLWVLLDKVTRTREWCQRKNPVSPLRGVASNVFHS
jgi:hypothetical protein